MLNCDCHKFPDAVAAPNETRNSSTGDAATVALSSVVSYCVIVNEQTLDSHFWAATAPVFEDGTEQEDPSVRHVIIFG
jgi:hypothetical protein